MSVEGCSADLKGESQLSEGRGDPCSDTIYYPDALPGQYVACLTGKKYFVFLLDVAAWFCRKQVEIKTWPVKMYQINLELI